jgi:DNA polymerase-3 subunit epsilon
MKLLIIDTETTDTSSGIVCEISATLYNVGNTPENTGAIYSVSTLIPVEKNEAEAINGIPSELTQVTKEQTEVTEIGINILDAIIDMAAIANYKVAFNAEFDTPIVDSMLKLEPGSWICAMKDISWGYPAKAHGSYKLTDLCLWMGIGISAAHRAGDDVRLLVECFNRQKSNLPELMRNAAELANSPTVVVIALVTLRDKDLAKNEGFIWNAPEYPKVWHKKVKQIQLEDYVSKLPFSVNVTL